MLIKAREGDEALKAKKYEEQLLAQEEDRQRLLHIERLRLEEESKI